MVILFDEPRESAIVVKIKEKKLRRACKKDFNDAVRRKTISFYCDYPNKLKNAPKEVLSNFEVLHRVVRYSAQFQIQHFQYVLPEITNKGEHMVQLIVYVILCSSLLQRSYGAVGNL